MPVDAVASPIDQTALRRVFKMQVVPLPPVDEIKKCSDVSCFLTFGLHECVKD
jgi:hypothetical protein